jgi:hypothetical protein
LLLPAAIALPLLVTAAGAWLSWRQAWQEARQETEHAADASAEYARRMLDGLLLRIERANDLLAGLSDAEIRAREAELHAELQRVAQSGPRAEGQGEAYLFVFDRDSQPLVGGSVFPVPREQSFAFRDFNQALRDPAAPALHVSPVQRPAARYL